MTERSLICLYFNTARLRLSLETASEQTLWQRCGEILQLLLKNHGWLPNLTITWTGEAYPEQITDLLTDEDSNGDDAEEIVKTNDMLSDS